MGSDLYRGYDMVQRLEPHAERIVAVAIWQDGMTCSVSRPARHHDVIRCMARAGIQIPIVGTQGFLTSHGRFVNRQQARNIAIAADQGIRQIGDELFSEDLW